MSTQTIVVDPVTRIEGHLRIEAQFDGSTITQASSSGTMVRGIEIILRGRDPRDAWAFCAAHLRGLYTGPRHRLGARRRRRPALPHPRQRAADPQSHDRDAVRARSCDAFLSPARARLGGRGLSALKADPKATSALAQSISSYARSSPGYFAEVQDPRQEAGRVGTARHFRQRLLGPSGVQAAAGSQPHGGGALSRCAGVAARNRAAAGPSSAARIRTPMCWWAALLPR